LERSAAGKLAVVLAWIIVVGTWPARAVTAELVKDVRPGIGSSYLGGLIDVRRERRQHRARAVDERRKPPRARSW
jgi:hypothetical protein